MLTKRSLGITFAVLCIMVISAGLFLEARWSAHFAQGSLTQSTEYQLEAGRGLNQISRDLQEKQIIDDALGFRVIARLQGLGGALKAGDYRFPQKISPDQVLQMLVGGKTQLYSLTIPEGLTSQQILARIGKASKLAGELPKSLAEASILPETYHFERGMKRKDLLALMESRWQKAIIPLWEARPDDYPLETLDEVLTLASIVEKEAVNPEEMPIIAGVFLNRLAQDIKLQSDPTVIYALSAGLGKLNRRLLRKDWKYPHDHNTYYRKGLPPTPIAHPSVAAVAATLQPAKHDFIFFVADGKGAHRFSVTLKEHNANVAKLNKLRKEFRKK